MAITPTRPHTRAFPELRNFDESVPELLARKARGMGAAAFITEEFDGLAGAHLTSYVAQVQGVLRRSGVRRGDVVAVQLPNWWETVVISYALWGLGCVLNPITPIYRGAELAIIFARSRPTLVLVPHRYRDIDYEAMAREALGSAVQETAVLSVRGPSSQFPQLGSWNAAASVEEVELQAGVDDISVLMFTSGTTGVPKGVLHSHRTLLYESWSIANRFRLERPVVFMPSPLTHITGLLYGVLLPLLRDGRVVLQDRWDAETALDLVERNGCDFSVGATPFLAGLADAYRRRGVGSSLEYFVCGGADVPPSLVRSATVAMGTCVVRAYGSTEVPTVSCGSPEDPASLGETTDGSIVGSSQARLVDTTDGVGDLEVCGPEMFLGYLNPSDNESAYTDDGWFKTGDLARLEDGFVTIAGRRKDIIVRGGENISAKEIEDLLLEMPSIQEVAVVGVPDEVLGERSCAVVVPCGRAPSLAEITSHLTNARIAQQKFPEYLLLDDALPRTASGKTQKFRIREAAAGRLALGEGEAR